MKSRRTSTNTQHNFSASYFNSGKYVVNTVYHPLVSVCIPVYNGEKYIAETILSVLGQTFSRIEILIQDNASTDGTSGILLKLAKNHPQISIENNEQTCGMSANWNLAINRARGDYIMLLSADDLLMPRFIEKCVECFAQRHVDVVTANHFYLRGDSRKKRTLKLASGEYTNFSELVLLKNPFSINFSMLSSKLINQISNNRNLFTRSLYTCDYDLWIRLSLEQAKVFYLDECLGVYRIHDKNLSSQTVRMYRQAALVVLAHKDKLKVNCALTYCLTLFRFLIRNLKGKYIFWESDQRLLKTLLKEIVRCAR